jgi:hypothetical protein
MSRTCGIDGCGAKYMARGYCQKHYTRVLRTGSPNSRPRPRGARPKYRAAHLRVPRQRGKASEYACEVCGLQAAQWAYDHTDPHELSQVIVMPKKDSAKLVYYSVDPYRYLALCRSDHVKYDMAVAELRAMVARDERSHCEAAAERMGP